ncbi:MAG: GTPase family protein [Pirellula sp.]
MKLLLKQLLNNPRIAVLFFVWTLPCILYVVLGIIALFQTGWLLMLVWVLPLNWLAAWLIATYWKPTLSQRSKQIAAPILPEFWGQRDHAAMQIVEDFRTTIAEVDENVLTDPQRYFHDIQNLSRRLASHYYNKKDGEALHPVTVVEILAVVHLAVEDLEAWTQENFPASEIATIGHLSKIPGITKQVGNLSNLAYFASMIFQPIKLLAYPIYRKSGVVATEIRGEIVTTVYQKFVQMAGFYLIEMYSGRLKAGSRIYKEQFGHLVGAVRHAKGDRSKLDQIKPQNLSIAIVGQVNAGKSSLVNHLLREQHAITSILPETKQVHRHRFNLGDSSIQISLLDTPGYSDSMISQESSEEILKGVLAADIVLLVIAANSPAKQPDVLMLGQLRNYYREHPELKPPRVIGVVTHIDLLRPIQEWQPPYDWRSPKTIKERSIHETVEYCKELFGDSIQDYVPLCLLASKSTQGSAIEELLELITSEVSQGQAVALVRAYYDQFQKGRLEKVVDQVASLVKQSIRKK